MPFKKGHSREVVSSNIKEMVRSGRDPKEAIAAALSSARKYKKMAEGGMVEDVDMISDTADDEMPPRSLTEIQEDGEQYPSEIANPREAKEEEGFVSALRRQAQDELNPEHFAMGGLVVEQGDIFEETVGSKPEDEVSALAEPLSMEPSHAANPGLSEAARMALDEKRKKRRSFMR